MTAGEDPATRGRSVLWGGAALGAVSLPAWPLAAPELPAAAVVLAGAVYVSACVVLVPVAGEWSPRRRILACAALTGYGAAAMAWMGAENAWLLLYALVAAAALLPRRWFASLVGVCLAGLMARGVAVGDPLAPIPDILMVSSVTAIVALLVSLTDANAQLRRARNEIALLAAARERERVARDLHDILGHSLTAIVVKAGLARRVLEKAGAPQAAAQVAEVEELSRRALGDVRATVDGYREVHLAVELANAAEVLRSAGVDADLPTAVDGLGAAHRSVFGYVLREAVTNVVRHAHADRVRVRLGEDWIEVTDDGRGCTGQPGDERPREGNGLSGLAERMRAVGGGITVGPGALAPGPGRPGFTVRAHGPGAALRSSPARPAPRGPAADNPDPDSGPDPDPENPDTDTPDTGRPDTRNPGGAA
jgi:two-component system, NarL family, sensor histidine kinase DesK